MACVVSLTFFRMSAIAGSIDPMLASGDPASPEASKLRGELFFFWRLQHSARWVVRRPPFSAAPVFRLLEAPRFGTDGGLSHLAGSPDTGYGASLRPF